MKSCKMLVNQYLVLSGAVSHQNDNISISRLYRDDFLPFASTSNKAELNYRSVSLLSNIEIIHTQYFVYYMSFCELSVG